MALFNIEVERFYREQIDIGNQLMGMFCLQYPIYCIHANISDTTPDALDNIDRVITDFLTTKPDFSIFQIASLLSVPKGLIETRLSSLLNDGLIEIQGKEKVLTEEGKMVFREKKKTRQHKRSYDFYLDGITFNPLPAIYYKSYSSKYISEYDAYLKTTVKGDEKIIKPFGPDLIHTPPEKETIISKIEGIAFEEREKYEIPNGLVNIDDLSFTKLSFQVLVAVLKNNGQLSKELIDPFASYSMLDNIPYTELLKKNIRIFEPGLKEKISNLEFRLVIPRKKEGESKEPLPVLTSNWPEIDKSKFSQNKCFAFAKDDIFKALTAFYGLNELDPESIVNTETELEININKKMLIAASDKNKLINDLIRQRDSKEGIKDFNVYLLYVFYKSSDPYVIEITRFKEMISLAKQSIEVNEEWIIKHLDDFTLNYRELLVSSGELELLERIDIEKYMLQLN